MKTTQEEALKKLEEYVNLPSGSYDTEDVEAFAGAVRADWEALGMRVVRHPGGALECTIGEGEDELLLLGHMDTVFPHAEHWPFRLKDDRAYGPGTMDMKGGLRGGVAENIIADEAEARCEVRFYDPAYQAGLLSAIEAICAQPGVPGTTTTLHVGASHPPFKANEKSARLLELAQEIGRAQGREITAESTGGAGDIAYVCASGIAALDGLGVEGFGAHTKDEYAIASSLLRNARFAADLIKALVQHPDRVR